MPNYQYQCSKNKRHRFERHGEYEDEVVRCHCGQPAIRQISPNVSFTVKGGTGAQKRPRG
jgi:putative FmdB family regulatory protein